MWPPCHTADVAVFHVPRHPATLLIVAVFHVALQNHGVTHLVRVCKPEYDDTTLRAQGIILHVRDCLVFLCTAHINPSESESPLPAFPWCRPSEPLHWESTPHACPLPLPCLWRRPVLIFKRIIRYSEPGNLGMTFSALAQLILFEGRCVVVHSGLAICRRLAPAARRH